MWEEKNNTSKELNELTSAVRDLSGKVSSIEKRLDKIEEGKKGMVAQQAPSSILPKPANYMLDAIQRRGEQKKQIEAPAGWTASLSKLPERENLESEIGMKWLGRVGIIALIFGISFFLKFAFENNWVGVTMRVVMGIIAGSTLIFLGEALYKKYAHYAQTLSGGGVGILYLSFYAASSYYKLIDPLSSFIAMAMITFLGGYLALRYDKLPLAALALFSGLLTPLIMAGNFHSAWGLFSYLTILNLGVLGLYFFRNWVGLSFLGLAGTLIGYLIWYEDNYSARYFFQAEIFLTVVFAIYLFLVSYRNIWLKNKVSVLEMATWVLNALGYFLLSYMLLDRGYSDFRGLIAIALAFIYFGLTYIVSQLDPEDKKIETILSVIAVFFLTAAAPIQFDNNAVTISWSLEALTLMLVGFALRSYTLRASAAAVAVLTAGRLVFYDTRIPDLSNYLVFLNARFLAFAVGIISASAIHYLYEIHDKVPAMKDVSIKPEEVRVRIGALVAAIFLILWIFSGEIMAYYDKQIRLIPRPIYPSCNVNGNYMNGKYVRNSSCDDIYSDYRNKQTDYDKALNNITYQRNVVLSIFWAIYAAILLMIGMFNKNKILRLFGIGLFGLTILKLFFFDLWSLGTIYRTVVSLGLGIALLVSSFYYNKYKNQINEIIKNS